jgi:large subunit ribosomal protein L4
MKAPLYDAAGKKIGDTELPESVFGLAWNADLVHQTKTAMETAARTPVAHAKNRGEVRGGGRKPWKQKGTGRARHGSSRSPIWVGGGKAHGPVKGKNFDRKVNRRAAAKALAVVLSQKLRDGEVVFVDALSFAAPKAADAKKAITAIAKGSGQARLTHRSNAALIALGEKSANVEKSFRNFGNVAVAEARSLNLVDALRAKVILIERPEVSVAAIASRLKAKVARA